MENTTKLKAEAIARMEMLEIFSDAIKQFKDSDTVMVSEGGILYWLNEEQKKIVSDFENEYEGLVYMVIHTHTEFGELYSLLYVSKHEEEWEDDREDLKDGYSIAAVYNVNYPMLELGSIGIKQRFGGLVRTA